MSDGIDNSHALSQPRRPPLTRRDVRRLIISIVAAGAIAIGLLYSCVFLMFLPSALAGTTDVREYARLRDTFEDLHGHHARALPHAIPAGASATRFKATLDDMLQAEPYLYLAVQLPADAAEVELARLRQLDPRVEGPNPFAPMLLRELGNQCDRAMTFNFAPAYSSNGIRACVWHDPATGWFCYELTSD